MFCIVLVRAFDVIRVPEELCGSEPSLEIHLVTGTDHVLGAHMQAHDRVVLKFCIGNLKQKRIKLIDSVLIITCMVS